MAPAELPPGNEIPILVQQNAILFFFAAVCLLLLAVVYLGDLKSRSPIQSRQSEPRPSRLGGGSSEAFTGFRSPNGKRKAAEPSEMTPLLSSESTLVGSESESSAPDSSTSLSRSQSESLWASFLTAGSTRASNARPHP